MQRDSFIFYRSYFEATKPLSQEQKAQLFDAICTYSLDQEQIELDPICTAMFSLIKPQIDANYKRFINGTKGAKIKQDLSKAKANPKQELSKAKANPKQELSKAKANVNVNVNVNDNDNVNDVHKSFSHLSISVMEYSKLVTEYSIKQVDDILDQIENFKGNTKYTSLYLTAKNWLKRRENDKPTNNKPSNFEQGRAFGISL